MQIIEGAAYTLKCPQHKCNALATPAMIQKLVGDELFRRYDEMLLASALNTMNDIVSLDFKICLNKFENSLLILLLHSLLGILSKEIVSKSSCIRS